MKSELKNETITVKYQTRKEFCECCDRNFDNAELGKVREFDVSLEKDVFNWTEWDYYFEYEDEDEMRDAVDECLYGMISFYAVKSNEVMRLCDGELDKVVQIVVDKYKK